MKRIFTLILFILLVSSFTAEASNAQRKISTGELSVDTAIKITAGTVYDIEIVATAAGGYATLYDTNAVDAVGAYSGKTKLIEVREATQYDSKHVSLGEYGIKAHTGITLNLNNVTAIIYYY